MRAAICAALLLAGCYDPKPPSGSYECGAPTTDGGTGSCPSSLQCICGLCVSKAEEAACSFSISSSEAKVTTTKVRGVEVTTTTLEVGEHETFPVAVTAYSDKAGTMPSRFSGTVTLSSSWGDVCVGTAGCKSLPDKVLLASGTGSATIQLNRETIPPQTAELRATFAGNVGTSGSLRITVKPPSFSATSTTIAPALTYSAHNTVTYGFANTFVGGAAVTKTAAGWNMYFLGGALGESGDGIGVATSTDGMTFTPQSTPVFSSSGLASSIGIPSAYQTSAGTTLYFGQSGVVGSIGYGEVVSITAPAGSQTFGIPTTLLQTTDFPFAVSALDAPMVTADPNPPLDGGGPDATILFATASLSGAASATGPANLEIVRALAPDGMTFDPDPSPLIHATLEEPIIYAPRVIVDGTVFKMFYATAAYSAMAPTCTTTKYSVAYATSSDGSSWIRTTTDTGAAVHVFEQPTSIVATAIVPVDGSDPSSGLVLYYSPYVPNAAGICILNGISRVASE